MRSVGWTVTGLTEYKENMESGMMYSWDCAFTSVVDS